MSSDNGRPNIVLVVLHTLAAEAAGLGRTPARMQALGVARRARLAALFTGFLPSEHRMEVPRQGLGVGKDLRRLAE